LRLQHLELPINRWTRVQKVFDFIHRCLDSGDDYLTGTLIVHALASGSGRGLLGIRVIVGSTLDAALGKT